MLTRSAKLKLGLTYWTSAAALFGIVAWSSLTVVDMKHDLGKAEKDRAALSQQVKDLGGTPVVGPRGNAGTSGRDGRDGDPGSPGMAGAAGRAGSTGAAGRNGANGKDGADGTPGAAGPTGAAGRDGRDGTDGRDGDVGPQGPEGPACPSGFAPTEDWVNGHQAVVCEKTPTLKG